MTTTNVFHNILQDLVNANECSPRGQKSKELLNYSVIIENPRDRIITSPDRKIKLSYLLAEWVWYLTGDPSIDIISKFAPFWRTIANQNNEVNSNYGTRIFGRHPLFENINQFETVIKTLKKDSYSRQAVITINSPPDLEYDNKDVPCTFSIQFLIRNNKLNMIVNMRSNDIIMGYCNDIFQFSMIHEMILSELNDDKLELGKYYHNAGSMHLYERHYTMANNIINNKSQLLFNAPSDDMPRISKKDIHNLNILLDMVSDLPEFKFYAFDLDHIKPFIELPVYWQSWIYLCWSDKYDN